MKTLRFYGYSDDSFCCLEDEAEQIDEIGCYDKPGAYLVESPSEGCLFALGEYAPSAYPSPSWVIGIAPVFDDDEKCKPFPIWPMRYGLHKNGYSPVLAIDVPDDAVVSVIVS